MISETRGSEKADMRVNGSHVGQRTTMDISCVNDSQMQVVEVTHGLGQRLGSEVFMEQRGLASFNGLDFNPHQQQYSYPNDIDESAERAKRPHLTCPEQDGTKTVSVEGLIATSRINNANDEGTTIVDGEQGQSAQSHDQECQYMKLIKSTQIDPNILLKRSNMMKGESSKKKENQKEYPSNSLTIDPIQRRKLRLAIHSIIDSLSYIDISNCNRLF